MSQLRNPNETELLKIILSEEFTNREILGKELHANKSYLTLLSQSIFNLERAYENGKINLVILDEQKQLISELSKLLQELRIKLFPPILTLSGILVGIKQYLVDYQKKHPVNVDLYFNPDERDFFGGIRDIKIYKNCVEILDFMFLNRAKSLQIYLKCDRDTFEFEILGQLSRKKENNFDSVKKLELIKGITYWSGAKVMPETNWKNRFKIRFKT